MYSYFRKETSAKEIESVSNIDLRLYVNDNNEIVNLKLTEFIIKARESITLRFNIC